MALQNTNLLIQMAPIPLTFKGKPQDFAEEMVRRMKIVSPSGTNFIFIGDVEPTSNVGPWLKDGVSWFVFDETLKRYVPLDISESETRWFHIGNAVPATSDPAVWLRTTLTPTEENPSFGTPIGWALFNGTAWEPFIGIVLSGPTANRPPNPEPFQQFYDTDISVWLTYERGAWRTLSGVPGDVKAVAFDTLTEALAHNPGWDVVGASNQNIRGRYISQATKDSGATPETQLSVSAGIAERAAFETFGETDGLAIDSSSSVPFPPTLSLWHLVKL